MVKLAIENANELRTFHVGDKSDSIIRIPWYRQFETPPPSARFFAGMAGDSTALTNRFAFRTVGAGLIADKAKSTYSFPIAVVNLKTGQERTALLRVPFEVGIPLPKQGAAAAPSTPCADLCPVKLQFLQTEGDQLQLQLAGGKCSANLMFDLKALGLGEPPR